MPRQPEPPRILDKLLIDFEPSEPPDAPPKVGIPLENRPPKAGLPPVKPVAITLPGAATKVETPRVTKNIPPPPESPAPATAFPVAAPPKKRSLAMAGFGAVMMLNVLLAVLVVLMYQERSSLLDVAQAPSPVQTVQEPPIVATAPEPRIPVAEPVQNNPAPPNPRQAVGTAAGMGGTPRSEIPGALHIPKLVLCRSASGFANYEPMPDTRLRPHHLPFIQAYVEIAHPKPERRVDGRHIYYMTKAMKLYRSDIGPSEPVMDSALSLVVSGLSPRNDFFSVLPLQATRRVDPGEYTLVVSITDQVSGETATQETSFFLHAD